MGCESEYTDIGATLVALVAGQDPVPKILLCSLVGWEDLDDELQHSSVDSAGTGEGLHDAYAVGIGFAAATGDYQQGEEGWED